MKPRNFERALRAARGDDQRALARLWDAHAGEIRGFLHARGTPDADEVVNDVFLAAFGQLERFDGGPAEFRGWLFAIARNKRVDAIRRAQRRPSVAGDPADERADDGVEAVAFADEYVERLLAPLTPEQRDVVVLRFVLDLDLESTAAALDKPLTAVKALQHRALERLRREVHDDPYPGGTSPTMS